MLRLFKIELHKICSYRTFWVLAGLYLALFLIITKGLSGFSFDVNEQEIKVGESIYYFPKVWHTLTYIGSWFTLLLSVLIIILITNEHSYRTLRQNIIDGLSRKEFLTGKILLILLFALAATFIIVVTALIYGAIHSEVAMELHKKMLFVPAFFVQCIGLLSLALLIALWVKRSGLAIGLYLLYIWVIEPIIGLVISNYISEKAAQYLPAKYLNGLIENPWLQNLGMKINETPQPEQFLFALVYICLFIGATYLLLQKRDLK